MGIEPVTRSEREDGPGGSESRTKVHLQSPEPPVSADIMVAVRARAGAA